MILKLFIEQLFIKKINKKNCEFNLLKFNCETIYDFNYDETPVKLSFVHLDFVCKFMSINEVTSLNLK